jgi:hypothetical protein
MIGGIGPALLPVVPPIRRYFGDVDPSPIPVTYPGTLRYVTSLPATKRRFLREEEEKRRVFADLNERMGCGPRRWRGVSCGLSANYLPIYGDAVPNGPRKDLTGYDD